MKVNQRQATIDNLIALIYATASGVNTWQTLITCFGELLGEEIAKNELDDMLEQLRFHFDKANEIQRNQDNLRSEHSALSGTLDHLPLAIVITHLDSRVYKANSHAQKLIDDGYTLYCDKKGRLSLTGLSKETKLLHKNIADTFFLQSEKAVRTVPIQTSQDDRHLSIALTPTSNQPELMESEEQLVTLYITSAAIRNRISELWLQETYGLLPHESQLTQKLVNECENLADAASELGLSIQTVRSYLKKVFVKTGTHSQSMLVKRILKEAPSIYGLPDKPDATEMQNSSLQRTHFIHLKDGRRLAYAEYGDVNGKPVLFCHSYVGSRLQVHPDYEILSSAGVRLIVPDRPGFGLSDPIDNYSPMQWADDARELLDSLAIASLPIIGFCVGATFAFACAHSMPGKVEKLVVVNPLGQVTSRHDLKGMLQLNKMILQTGLVSPTLMRHVVRLTFRDFAKQPEKLLSYLNKHVTPADRKTISQKNILPLLADCYHETLLQSSDSLYKELLLCLSPWEKMLEEITTKVDLVHGGECSHVPLHFGQRIASGLVNCESYFPATGGFYLIFEKWAEIVDLAIQKTTVSSLRFDG